VDDVENAVDKSVENSSALDRGSVQW